MSTVQEPITHPPHCIPDRGALVNDARQAQREWALLPLCHRLRKVRTLRHHIAASANDLATAVPCELPGSLHRSAADTLVAEVLPLVEACSFLEREAPWILAPRREEGGNAFWLGKVSVEIRREPVGVVLLIAPGNYPLFLPGVQALQALVAGNAVLWKPAPGGTAAARALRGLLIDSGLAPHLLQILDESVEAAIAAIDAGVDKVFLTGSAETGRTVSQHLAQSLIPAVMELSGCDAVFVLEGANIGRIVEALTFGMRLNGSATCMAPRRIFATASVTDELVPALVAALESIPPVPVPRATHTLIDSLVHEAQAMGARVWLDGRGSGTTEQPAVRAILLSAVVPEMRLTSTDVFAPILSFIEAASEAEALAAYAHCPYSLTAAIFGPLKNAERLADKIGAGNVLINDLIVSTADPRATFGGRRSSGFGSTRGREGLLEMTNPKTVLIQRSRNHRAYQATTPGHAKFFAAYLRTFHSATLRDRFTGLVQLTRAALKLR